MRAGVHIGGSLSAQIILNTTYRLFPSTNGPGTVTSFTGAYGTGTGFKVTSDSLYFSGYWWWVCPTGQATTGIKFALWQETSAAAGLIIANSTVTAGTLTAGQWNYVPLTTPLAISKDAQYRAANAYSAGGFPLTNSQYDSGGPFAAGITNGPLFAFSDNTGSAPDAVSNAQSSFQTANTDPTVVFPASADGGYNGWLDLQVQTLGPSGGSFRLWPSFTPIVSINSQTIAYTLACEFVLSASSTLDNIWFFSPATATVLPTEVAIWDESTSLVFAGTQNASPSWSGAAGSGWVSCANGSTVLPPGHYRVSVFYGGGAQWFAATTNYWSSGGGANGISAGPLSAPNLTNATSPGQAPYNTPTYAYPNTWSALDDGGNYWVDVEVTPL